MIPCKRGRDADRGRADSYEVRRVNMCMHHVLVGGEMEETALLALHTASLPPLPIWARTSTVDLLAGPDPIQGTQEVSVPQSSQVHLKETEPRQTTEDFRELPHHLVAKASPSPPQGQLVRFLVVCGLPLAWDCSFRPLGGCKGRRRVEIRAIFDDDRTRCDPKRKTSFSALAAASLRSCHSLEGLPAPLVGSISRL